MGFFNLMPISDASPINLRQLHSEKSHCRLLFCNMNLYSLWYMFMLRMFTSIPGDLMDTHMQFSWLPYGSCLPSPSYGMLSTTEFSDRLSSKYHPGLNLLSFQDQAKLRKAIYSFQYFCFAGSTDKHNASQGISSLGLILVSLF